MQTTDLDYVNLSEWVGDSRRDLHDQVYGPKHYQLFPDMEAIDVIRKVLTTEEFRGYCKGNILKYRLRAGNKDGEEALKDLKKVEVYSEWLNETY